MNGQLKDINIEEWISHLVEREIKNGISWSRLNLTEDAPFRLCYLCHFDFPMSKTMFEQHCERDEHHQERLKEINKCMTIRRTMGARWKTAGQLDERIEQLGLLRWQADVEKILYNYISIGSEDEIHNAEDLYDKACAVLRQHEKREYLSLLELAVWKTACLLEPPEMPKNPLAFLDFLKEGWKVNKAKMRGSSSIAIVVQQVMPFLE